MTIEALRKYLRVAFDGANDGGAGGLAGAIDPAAGDPAAGAGDAGDPAAGDPSGGDAGAGDPPAGGGAAARKQPSPIIAELAQQRARRREAEQRNSELEARAVRAEREAADARAIAERLAKGQGGDGGAGAMKTTARQPDEPTNDEAAVNQRAQMIIFRRDVDQMRARAFSTFGQAEFNQTISSLAALGADTVVFVRDVLDVDSDNAHVLFHELAQDEARTLRLVNMTPTQRIAELTRMSIAQQNKGKGGDAGDDKGGDKGDAGKGAAPAPKPGSGISRAPRPAPAITPAGGGKDLPRFADKKSDAEFDKDFDDWGKRRSRR